MSNLLITRDDRRPTLRFGRPNFLEPGIQVVYYWNGTHRTAMACQAALQRSITTRRWPGRCPSSTTIQLIPFGGQHDGPYAGVTARRLALGRLLAAGPTGPRGYGVGGSWFDWQFPFPLRDGVALDRPLSGGRAWATSRTRRGWWTPWRSRQSADAVALVVGSVGRNLLSAALRACRRSSPQRVERR